MRISAVRFFISSIYGNVDVGRVLDISDSKANQLVRAGLAKEIVTENAVGKKPSSFQYPVEAKPSGSSLPADQASQEKIASVSDVGGKKVKYRKRGSRS